MASALASAASERQLLIDDADLLHQCLVSLAGEHNVNLLLKRFQQREAAATAPASKPPGIYADYCNYPLQDIVNWSQLVSAGEVVSNNSGRAQAD